MSNETNTKFQTLFNCKVLSLAIVWIPNQSLSKSLKSYFEVERCFDSTLYLNLNQKQLYTSVDIITNNLRRISHRLLYNKYAGKPPRGSFMRHKFLNSMYRRTGIRLTRNNDKFSFDKYQIISLILLYLYTFVHFQGHSARVFTVFEGKYARVLSGGDIDTSI